MGLEQVKKEILDKADEEAGKIVEKAKNEAEGILKKTKEEIEAYRKGADEDTKKLIEAMERKVMAAAEFDVKKMKLDRKKEIIDSVFEQVEKELRELPDRKREENIKKLLAKAKKDIEVKYVHANENDRKIVQKISGVQYKETDIIGGIVAESPDLNFVVDISYDELLQNVRKTYLQEIAKMLFD
ncbi:hypothetical protein COV19_03275 [Candidatus Woesearchaeota archaeon CG10_big_fil_rev_8_21_14_0_10_44_13]|nr:MAG: hypothetical protein COV19_03275 [Candidatus Woesearchaeota archaeon CG10_big_fil_rev_8_21_14_0_10_44_13]